MYWYNNIHTVPVFAKRYLKAYLHILEIIMYSFGQQLANCEEEMRKEMLYNAYTARTEYFCSPSTVVQAAALCQGNGISMILLYIDTT